MDELIPFGTECDCVGGLKTHYAPWFISSDKSVTMPATGPDENKLNADHLIMVTQGLATMPVHRDTFQEVVRVVDMAANRKGALGEEAKAILIHVKSELLAQSVNIVIEWTHTFIPDSYF